VEYTTMVVFKFFMFEARSYKNDFMENPAEVNVNIKMP